MQIKVRFFKVEFCTTVVLIQTHFFSPELRPDLSKDYSVYILDPLEDLMSKSRHGQSGGVAVGMGLLSNILASNSNDVSMVTGTFVGCGQNEDALEVVISLKQVLNNQCIFFSLINIIF